MNFSEKIYSLRKEKGLTQTDLAEKLNVSRQAVSRWEMGTAKPEVDTLIAMSELFEVTLDYLLKNQEFPTVSETVPLPAETADEKKDASIKWIRAAVVLFAIGAGTLVNVLFFTGIMGTPFPAVFGWAGGILMLAGLAIGLVMAVIALARRRDQKK